MSVENMVEVEFTSPLKVAITAAISPASTTPRTPDRREFLQGKGEGQILVLGQHSRHLRGLVHHVDPMPDDQAEEAGDQRAKEVDGLGEDQAHQAVPGCACGQDALHHRLVAHLVESHCPEDGDEHSQEGRHRMAGRLVKVHAFGTARRLGPLDHRVPAAGNLMQARQGTT